ncbi:unnamed protein product [Rangifer tarandus platyrhynchus]|uniref:Uncharacterized protein n=2 Tax=Rangifer tarandus platyrhynchus TaxID=3082113 RepID=A0ABN8Y9P4_RANTA|nr:unnamed protein product [Rangifer tarandus platyrhynchus]
MQTQKTLSGLHRGTPLTLERLRPSLRRRKRRSRMSPLRMKPHNHLLLLGLINVILNLTSVSTQDNAFTSWAHSCADFHNTYNFWGTARTPNPSAIPPEKRFSRNQGGAYGGSSEIFTTAGTNALL